MQAQTEDPELFHSLRDTLKPMNTTKDVAGIGIAEGTLAYWRSTGIGPKFVKVGRTVLYPRETLIAYFRDHVYQSTSEVTNSCPEV
ncbi:helix-turn-helix transcriptional regulator [Bifidobacterium callitrichos]|uniref:DNA-binding protein n=1 Tax=Bifidobacterium callitrichos DSM 23973 TaxID=1437609 RepID=A0A086ZVN8_9BIFI|nr:helix-turn-helix domain-containing protein [Bifidobacterium callitrichos]KFI50588.1 hypothetical protein BCAL_1726 [Bifidobacterium callitrichos DSM 23973]PST48582.1 DNA-binding protein [Bifidobacterium callitrichos]